MAPRIIKCLGPLLVLVLAAAVIVLKIDLEAKQCTIETLQNETLLLKALLEDRRIFIAMQNQSTMLMILQNDTIKLLQNHSALKDHPKLLAAIQTGIHKLTTVKKSAPAKHDPILAALGKYHQMMLLRALLEDCHILTAIQQHSGMLKDLQNDTLMLAVLRNHLDMMDSLKQHKRRLTGIQDDVHKLIAFQNDLDILPQPAQHDHILKALQLHDQIVYTLQNHTHILEQIQELVESLKVFQNQLQTKWVKPAERSIFLNLLDVFINVTEKKNLSYFLYGGTLLGFARIKDILPWDDDFDIGMEWSDFKQFEQEIGKSANYRTHLMMGRLLKFFSTTAFILNYTDLPWKWPFLDILAITKTDKTVSEFGYSFELDDVYPLKEVLV